MSNPFKLAYKLFNIGSLVCFELEEFNPGNKNLSYSGIVNTKIKQLTSSVTRDIKPLDYCIVWAVLDPKECKTQIQYQDFAIQLYLGLNNSCYFKLGNEVEASEITSDLLVALKKFAEGRDCFRYESIGDNSYLHF